ncbi:MAG: hypothetical protein ACE5PV_10795 [Candidatus Poribacteria bacterium]
MKSRWIFLLTIALLLLTVIPVSAEIQSVRFHILGHFTNYQEQRVKHALSPWIDEKYIEFKDMGDFVTIVEIKPPEHQALKLYRILKQLKDTRLRGEYSQGGHLLWRTEATAVGQVYRHQHGFYRFRYPREQPALWVADTGQTFLMEYSKEADELQMMVNDKINREMIRKMPGEEPIFPLDYPDVIVNGVVSAFDGHYPVLVVKEFGDAEKGLPRKKTSEKRKRHGLLRWLPFF